MAEKFRRLIICFYVCSPMLLAKLIGAVSVDLFSYKI